MMFEPYIPQNNRLFNLFSEMEQNQLSMFMAVYFNLKPLMDTFLPAGDYLKLQEACKSEGILVDNNGIMTVFPDEKFLKPKERLRNLGTTKMTALPFSPQSHNALVHTFISRSRDLIDKARKLTWYNLFVGDLQLSQSLIDNFRYGAVLGFPECCARFYAAHNGRFFDGKNRWEWNTPFEVADNTKGAFSFLCNHIPMDYSYFLIHHYPCCYNCGATMNLGGKLLERIRKEEPRFGDLIEKNLKMPYLVFGEKRAFVFDGRTAGGAIDYKDCCFLGDGRDLERYSLIPEGNRLELSRQALKIYKDGQTIGGYETVGDYSCRIFNFS